MYDLCNCFVNDVLEQLKCYFGEQVYCMVILCNVCLVEVLSFGMLVMYYDKLLIGVKVYLVLVGEILCCRDKIMFVQVKVS